MTETTPIGTGQAQRVTTRYGSRGGQPVLGIELASSSVLWAVLEPDEVTRGGGRRHGGGERVLASGRLPAPPDDADDVLETLAGLIADVGATVFADRAAAATGPTTRRLVPARVGLAAATIIDGSTGSVLVGPEVPGNWTGRSLGAELAARCGQPVSLVNDSRAFALGQLRHGAAAAVSDAVFVTLGTRIGGAVASDGVLRLGSGARGGELGHAPVVLDGGRGCCCGATGCLETVAGGKALAWAGAELVRAGSAPALAARVDSVPALVSAADVIAAAADDPECARLVARAGRALGLVLAGLATTLAPELVVVGGGLAAAALPVFRPLFEGAFARHARLIAPPKVVNATFGDLAAAVGAAAWARCPPAATVPNRGDHGGSTGTRLAIRVH